jgi:hypothetical protein
MKRMALIITAAAFLLLEAGKIQRVTVPELIDFVEQSHKYVMKTYKLQKP